MAILDTGKLVITSASNAYNITIDDSGSICLGNALAINGFYQLYSIDYSHVNFTTGSGFYLGNKSGSNSILQVDHLIIRSTSSFNKIGVMTESPQTQVDVNGVVQISGSNNKLILNGENASYYMKTTNNGFILGRDR